MPECWASPGWNLRCPAASPAQQLTIVVQAERRCVWRQRRKHFSGYSKWHRLNQEVKKTTKKNKLDKIHHLCHFEADLGSAATHSLGVWIGRAKHIYGKPKSMKLWKASDTSAVALYQDAFLVASPRCARFWRRCTPDLYSLFELNTTGNIMRL